MTQPPPLSPAPHDPACAPGCAATRCPLRDLVPLVLRIGVGGLLAYAGWLKLGIASFGGLLPTIDPSRFAFAIKAFDLPGIGNNETIIGFLAYTIPWIEIIAGAMLVLGLWSRGAALSLTLLLAAFTAGIIGVLASGKPTDCPCFGSQKFICDSTIGACHVWRNAALMAAALAVVVVGPGAISADRLLRLDAGRADRGTRSNRDGCAPSISA